MEENTPKIESAGLFPPQPVVNPCSYNECISGHRWAPTVLIAGCTGCQGPVLAFKQENCPFCNEPIHRVSMRSDFVPGGAGIAQRCRGAKVQGETVDLDLTRHLWHEAQDNHLVFEKKKEIEDGQKQQK